jgi:hypothetical protein
VGAVRRVFALDSHDELKKSGKDNSYREEEMRKSIEEEIVAALWIIAALLSFGFDFKGWGWVFAIKGVGDVLCSILYAIEGALNRRRQ